MKTVTLIHRGTPIICQPITKNRICIGSHVENDVVVSEDRVRDRQMVIFMDSSGSWKSKLANGDSVTDSRITPGDRISFGDLTVEFGQVKNNTNCGLNGSKGTNMDMPPDEIATMGIVGRSQIVLQLCFKLKKVAPINGPVLIVGETGTGKELAARAVHLHSPRKRGPFIAVNCGALTASMVEDVFFGHERGSFTGAAHIHRGVFEQADTGTLFLDEIGELPLPQQATLLRVLDNGRVSRIGSEKEYAVNFRLVAATNRNLRQMVNAGQFRLDLYHRIATLQVEMPPLKDRIEDVELLAPFLLRQMSGDVGAKELSSEALEKLANYNWPGNVRELKNVLYRSAALSVGAVIGAADIALDAPVEKNSAVWNALLSDTLDSVGGNISAAARRLGIPRSTLRYRLRRMEEEYEQDKSYKYKASIGKILEESKRDSQLEGDPG